jgi:hypothetical protein
MLDFGGGGDGLEERLFLAGVVGLTGILIAAFGLLAIWVRWLVERPRPDQPTTSISPPDAPVDVQATPTQPQGTPD